jgi:hypothetical protein
MPMFRHAVAVSMTAFLPLAAALATVSPDDSTTRINAAPARNGWFVCDSITGPYALFAGSGAGVGGTGGTSLITLLDRRTGRFDTRSYQVGPGDPGAGQIHYSLSLGGKEVGNVHAVNPAMIDDDGATVPTVTSVTLGDRQLDCRWLAHTRFIGLDSRRSVVVTETPQGLVYEAFSFKTRGPVTNPDGVQRSNKPTLRLVDGTEMTGTLSGFRFANAGYVYFIQRPKSGEAAALIVTHHGKLVQSEKLVGFTYAPPLGRGPGKVSAALGPDAVWSGEGLDACRKATEANAVDSCLLDLMRKDKASVASVAFTQKLIAADSPGYVSGWKQAGPIGIASVSYPFRANTNYGTWLVPAIGDPIDADGYVLTSADKARADYKAALANDPDGFPVPPGEVTVGKAPNGNLRILVTTATASCHACAPSGQIIVGYDFDDAGRFLGASLIAVA